MLQNLKSTEISMLVVTESEEYRNNNATESEEYRNINVSCYRI